MGIYAKFISVQQPKTARRRWTEAELKRVHELALDLGKTWSDVHAFQEEFLPNRSAGATWVKVLELRKAAEDGKMAEDKDKE